MKILKNKTAAVTGAASGMGRMLAVRLADEGCHLALADMKEPGLKETVALVGGRVRVTTHVRGCRPTRTGIFVRRRDCCATRRC